MEPTQPPLPPSETPLSELLEDRLRDARDFSGQVIREHPFMSVGVAFVAGILVAGKLFGRPLARTVAGGTMGLAGRAFLAIAKPAAFQFLQGKVIGALTNSHVEAAAPLEPTINPSAES